jgi:hypothetical protein
MKMTEGGYLPAYNLSEASEEGHCYLPKGERRRG